MKKLTSLSVMTAGIVTLSVGCVNEAPVTQVQPPPGPAPVMIAAPGDFSPPAAEVVRLAQAGTSEDVMLAYVQNSAAPFSLNADQILRLRDLGVGQNVITAMLNRDAALQAQPPVVVYNQQAYPATVPPPAEVAAPATVAPDATAAVAPAPVYVSSPPADVTYFYDDLAPYGTWIQVGGIGWCWQPRVVVTTPTWRPYCDGGHWIYTDAGWYWQSVYSWGWAPFHYGRWQLDGRCGWVWVPDRVWGPSWVMWRSVGDNCGWAPLPPHAVFDAHLGWRFNGVSVGVNFDFGLRPEHYTFVAMRDFNAHDLGHRRFEQPEVTKIYNNTTIINNYVVNNNTVINQGIRVENVSAATHTDMRRVAIHDVPVGTAAAARSQAPGRTEVAYRAELKEPTRPVNTMTAQKIDDRHPVIAHGAPAAAATAGMPNRTVHTPVTAAPQGNVRQAQPAQAPAQVYPPQKVYQPSPPAAHSAAPGRTVEQPNTAARPVAAAPAQTGGNRYPNQPAPVSHPVAVAQPVTPTPLANHPVEPPKPVTRTSSVSLPAPKPSPPHPIVVAEGDQPSLHPGASKPEQPHQLYPVQMSAPPRPNPSQPVAEGQSSHAYQPKSAHQASEAHALPPQNPRPASPASHGNEPKGQAKKAE